MNRNLKAIGVALLAAVMSASLAGCAKKDDNGVYVDKNGNISINESEFENYVDSVFGGGDNLPSEMPNVTQEETLAVTDEIKNAALDSGFVQYNNDIFQRGGYITVADFVEKYKDRYDIYYNYSKNYTVKEDPYEECKDYLLEYDKDEQILKEYNLIGWRWPARGTDFHNYTGNDYYLTLKPQYGSNCQPVTAYVVNMTSPDEKITLDKAIVVEIESSYNHYKYITPGWLPMGFNSSYFKDEYESENKNYTVKNLGEALEAKGLKKHAQSELQSGLIPNSSRAENFGTYWKSGSDQMGCYVLGEENLFGAKPLYYYEFEFDPNTDKLDSVSCMLEYFVKE